MSLLKKLIDKHKVKGKIVYDLCARELGVISNIVNKNENQYYEITTKETEIKLTFPQEQFFIDGSDAVYLLPKWVYNVRIASTELNQLEHKYEELNNLYYALDPKTYEVELIKITEKTKPYVETIQQKLQLFKDYLKKLKTEKEKIIRETSKLMALRLLEYKNKAKKTSTGNLTKKEYSIRIIDLRTRYAIVNKAIQIFSQLYDDAKSNLTFLGKIHQRLNNQNKTESEFSLATII